MRWRRSSRTGPIRSPTRWPSSAMALIGEHIRTAYAEPRNAAAREAMMLGATQAGLAFSNASVALVHGMSRPIGAHFHVPHGLSNAMLLPAITRFSVGGGRGALRRGGAAHRLCRRSDADAVAAAKLVTGLEALNKELAVPTPVRLRHRRGRLERQDGADGRAGAGLRQPGEQSARARRRRRSWRCIARSGPARRATPEPRFAFVSIALGKICATTRPCGRTNGPTIEQATMRRCIADIAARHGCIFLLLHRPHQCQLCRVAR